MSENVGHRIVLERVDGLSPRVALLYSMMEKARERLLKKIDGLPKSAFDYSPHGRRIETIGTLLLHVAAVEWSWIFEDIGDTAMDYEKWKHAFALREDIDQLTRKKVQFYLDRLSEVRQEVFEWLKGIKDEDLDRTLRLGDTEVNIEWILFHIIEHEAMHVGQISVLKRMFEMTRVKVPE
ncbi:MAG: DinB family protein [Candidatus Thorarchaeota archaeon]